MAVTKIEELKKLSKGIEVELPGWDETPFICKLKRPSLLNLAGNGQIPNELLNAAYIVFNGSSDKRDVVSLKERNELFTIVAKAAMVEPTYEELQEIGLELTDLQLMQIFNFTQVGLNGLISFRAKQSNIKNTENKRKV